MLHDVSLYGPNPHLFNPDRFLKEDGTVDPNVLFPDPAFGFGRRFCAGKDLALLSLWITMANILACFDVTRAVDEDGNVIEPNEEYTSGSPS
jgi:cytochrome P450